MAKRITSPTININNETVHIIPNSFTFREEGDAVSAERWRGCSEQGTGLCKPDLHVDQGCPAEGLPDTASKSFSLLFNVISKIERR